MFDLFKDIDKYKGIPPYASEHYGVYQPLLGWQSKLTKNWVQKGGLIVDPRVKSILDARLVPGPTRIQNGDPREFLALPLQPASGKSPFRVGITKDLNSELMKQVRISLQAFADNPATFGRLPKDNEWNQIIEINNLMDEDRGMLRKVNDILRDKIFQQMKATNQPINEQSISAAKQTMLQVMQYESQIATFLLMQAEGQNGADPNELNKIFSISEAPSLADVFRSEDPLANIDPNDKSGVLSPVGFVHLFRQYFFDLGTFLGEPVEHVWLAPGTTIELIEVSTRKKILEHSEETALDTTVRTESSTQTKDEVSEAVKNENSNSTKLGVSIINTVNYGVYQGTASANFGVESTRKDAREQTQKNTREQAEKISSEIKRSFKSMFKTVTETTDTRSRRYVLQNTGQDLINYELRRKMRRVGVQLQDLGSQLCWQVFIDNAGADVGLSELVHFAESPNLSDIKQPEIGPPPAPINKPITIPIPFQAPAGHSNDDYGPGANYGETTSLLPSGFYEGHRVNTNDEDAEDARVVMGPFHFKFDPPQSNYALTEVRLVGPKANQQAIGRPVDTTMMKADGNFSMVMNMVNFGGQPTISFDVVLVFTPQAAAFTEYEKDKTAAQKQYNEEVSKARKKSFMENVRQRIDDASNIVPRPSWDLREEERTVIYRQLIQKLMLDSWAIAKNNSKKDSGSNLRLSHVRSEVIRSIFDVDAMLYFVAPEWWMPREHRSKHTLSITVLNQTVNLTNDDTVKWKDIESRQDNYLITEKSTPARLGSSLGWLLQLDGDNLRNAFLNAPWVKAVIPVRPGREKAALNWLRSIEGHEHDGWDSSYTAVTDEEKNLVAELEDEGKTSTIGNVLEKIAEKMEKENSEIANLLEVDKVFEHGFDHLAGGFDAGLPANQVFSQWISILPTDQIVAQSYVPTDLFK